MGYQDSLSYVSEKRRKALVIDCFFQSFPALFFIQERPRSERCLRTRIAEAVGRAGEERVAAVLESVPDGRLFRNLLVPCGCGRTAEIDAVLLTRKGLFVVEVKDWRGSVVGSRRLSEWTVRLKGKRGTKPLRLKRYNPIKQNAAHVQALSRHLGLPASKRPSSLVVFSSRSELKKVPPSTKDFTIIKEHMLKGAIARRLKARDDLFTESERRAIAQALGRVCDAAERQRRRHVAGAKEAERKRLEERERRRRRH